MRLRLFAAASAILACSLAAKADSLLFNLSANSGSTNRSAGSAPAQGVIVGQNTTITSFAFYVEPTVAENLKFFVTDSTGSDVLYSGVEAVGASSNLSWITSNSLSLLLTAGNEYYFGVVGDGNDTLIGYQAPSAYSSNGLTADTSGNANTTSYSNPTLFLHSGAANIDLQLYGTQSTVTPEPSSLALLGTGVLGVIGAARRRFKV